MGSANSFWEVEIHLEELELTWGRKNLFGGSENLFGGSGVGLLLGGVGTHQWSGNFIRGVGNSHEWRGNSFGRVGAYLGEWKLVSEWEFIWGKCKFIWG